MNESSTFISQLSPSISHVVAIAGATALLHFVSRLGVKNWRTNLSEADSWSLPLLEAAERPLPWLIWVAGIAFAFKAAERDLSARTHDLLAYLSPLREILFVTCLAWFLIRLSNEVRKHYVSTRSRKKQQIDVTTAEAVSNLAKLTICILAGLIALQSMGYSIAGVLAAGGVGGIAIGFAAKDLLANFFGGLTIYLDRPFNVGDWIRSPDRQIEGTVEAISWRHTRIRAFNKNPVYVPNSVFTTIVLENPSRMTHRRISETIGLRYEDLPHVEAIVADIKQMLGSSEDIDVKQSLVVNFNGFAQSSVNLMVYAFTKTCDWQRYQQVKQNVLLKIAAIITSHGAEIAFPTSVVVVDSTEPTHGSATIFERPPQLP